MESCILIGLGGSPLNKQNRTGLNYEIWARKILYFYWLMAIISIGGQIVGLIVTHFYYSYYISEFIMLRMILPSTVLLGIMLVCELMVKVLKIHNPYILIFAGSFLALTMILGNPALPGLQLSLLLPMAISLIYLNKIKLSISFTVNFAGLLAVYILSSDVRNAMSPYEYFAYLFVLFGGFIVYLAVIERGGEVLENIRQANAKEKELLVKNKIMEKLAMTDALTGLYNHKTFHEYMEILVEKGQKSYMPLQLAVLDIDNFKKINDDYGHSAGDAVLKKVAEVLLGKATKDDVVARYGGEEFAILFTEKSFGESYLLVEEMRKAIADLQHPEILDRNVTVSIGLENLNDFLSKNEFFKQADALLYEAKRSGKNKVISGKQLQYYL